MRFTGRSLRWSEPRWCNRLHYDARRGLLAIPLFGDPNHGSLPCKGMARFARQGLGSDDFGRVCGSARESCVHRAKHMCRLEI
jgi:hypothetical protein